MDHLAYSLVAVSLFNHNNHLLTTITMFIFFKIKLYPIDLIDKSYSHITCYLKWELPNFHTLSFVILIIRPLSYHFFPIRSKTIDVSTQKTKWTIHSLSFSVFNSSYSLKHINSVGFRCQIRRRSKQREKKINAILSLDGSRVNTIINDASL